MDLAIYSPLVRAWYQWGHFVALAIALASVFLVFYDAGRRGLEPTVWKAITVISVVLVLPSLIFWGVPTLFAGSLSAAVVPLAYAGMTAATLSLLSLVLYVAGVAVGTEIVCPVCGEPQLPSWEYCPYCAQRQAQEAALAAEGPPPAPAPPPVIPTKVMSESPQPSREPAPARTEVLRPMQPEELAWLILISGTHAGKEFRLGETTSIGRDPAHNDIVVDDSTVSRQHAKVRLQEGQFFLYDLASTDGTFIQNQESGEWSEIHKHQLADGDRIKMGRTHLAFMQVAEAEA
jgi:hypothetical protein